ncbi:alpha-amylase [Pedobacter sp. ASV28]|uniref:alpha-amylase n=1 Tax=Pedobacter sp. ASV28 TaxID=2795123 RepID=UPI0018ED5B9F|nr:alpha-amylase [Pedobacter sp. ASV28]
MQNQTLVQYFHWYYNEKDNLWTKIAKEAENLANLGITKLWIPPAFKGADGVHAQGYDTYDLYDLGEFDQKNSVATKYGTKEELLTAIKALQQNHIEVIADVVFNHKAGGDELENIPVRKVDPENRNQFISEIFEIAAWTKFTFPGRKGTYSDFTWDFQCFSGTDWAEDLKETGIYSIQNQYGDKWENVPSTEHGNFDYLMCNDIDFRNLAVKEELKKWAKWFYDTCKIDGFRLDAVKHISPGFVIEWIDFVKAECSENLFFVSENWTIENVGELQGYIETTEGRTQLFDSMLHHQFYLASIEGNTYNLSKIFDDTLVQVNPLLAVTFVDNHDSQPMQALQSYVDFWFRPLAYAMILLREQGIPCIFFPDLYGADYEDNETPVTLAALPELMLLLKARRYFAYGLQRDYLDHPNCIGWTREGDVAFENSGLAVLLSNGEAGTKKMEVGQHFAGKTFIDSLNYRAEEIVIGEDGFADFYCNAGSVSVWILK